MKNRNLSMWFFNDIQSIIVISVQPLLSVHSSGTLDYWAIVGFLTSHSCVCHTLLYVVYFICSISLITCFPFCLCLPNSVEHFTLGPVTLMLHHDIFCSLSANVCFFCFFFSSGELPPQLIWPVPLIINRELWKCDLMFLVAKKKPKHCLNVCFIFIFSHCFFLLYFGFMI